MLRQSHPSARLLCPTTLLVLILVLGGCGAGCASTPSPEAAAVAVTPAMTILANPNISDVPAGEQVVISVEATGANLEIRWSATRGALSSTEGPSTIYTAPNEPGPDAVTVIVTSGGGVTTKTIAFTVVAAQMTTPAIVPTVTPSPSPPGSDAIGVIELNPDDFVVQDGDNDGIVEEFFLDICFGAIPGLPVQDGVDLSNCDLEFTFRGGDGKKVQLWYKNGNWANVYSFPYTIDSDQPIRYNPFADGRNVDEFIDFTHIYAIGAKVFGGIEDVEITSARIITPPTPSMEGEEAIGGPLVTPTAQSLAHVGDGNALPPIVEGEFVTRLDTQLMLGGRPFRFVGTNAYFLQPEMAYGNTGGVIETLDAMVALGMPVVRIWAFNDHDPAGDPAVIQVEPGVYREESLVALDQVVAEAKERNIRLILTLVNYWPDYGGVDRYLQWYQEQCNCQTNRNDFYTNARVKGWYKDYVRMLVNRTNTATGIPYKDEPTILAWELGNELRNPGGRIDDLLAWQEEMAAFIKDVDANHLVGDGGEGFDDATELYSGLGNLYAVRGGEGASFHRLVNQPSIDMVSYHLYPDKWGLNDESDVEIWIRAHEELAQQAGKVAYLGEYGVPGEDALRAATFDRWLKMALIDNQGAGSLVWGLVHEGRPDYDGFSVYCPAQTETCVVLRAYAVDLTIGTIR